MDASGPDPSSFYRLNEELAHELARLDEAGALDGLRALLAESGGELFVTSVRAREGLEELLGVLRPGPGRASAPAPAPLAPAEEAPPAGCGSGCGSGEAAPAPAPPARAPGGWDSDGYLAVRSRFTIVGADGDPREVYMPDHVCPSCWNEDDNRIEACARVCAACGFAW